MVDISMPTYDKCRAWIKEHREMNKTWEEIKYGLGKDEKDLASFIDFQIRLNNWPSDLTKEIWYSIVKSEQDAEKNSEITFEKIQSATLIDSSQDNECRVPTSPQSSWQLYKKHLLNSGWKEESVEEMERATISILRRLNMDTRESGPVKGLVIGHVQSGKTANMAGLMAMAADWGWNFFIVLSGTIENLRRQTQSRLFRDLNRPGNLVWMGLEHLSKKSPRGQQAQDLRFEEGSNLRYFTVCLKNKSRLKGLIEWMQNDPHKHQQMKVLVIDDEADQASINTADINSKERAQINKLIINLVEGKKPNGDECKSKVKSMNYISYTATPYANFLNESGRESLYPRNFIFALQPSNEYFGPQQIFGVEGTDYEGLNIIRHINDEDYSELQKLHRGIIDTIPQSMKESVCWFLCAAAALRLWGRVKPISMLVHTSQRQGHHQKVATALYKWIKFTEKQKILAMCKEIWERECERFDIKSFRESYPDYGKPNEEIRTYPPFDELVEHIYVLLKDITNIPLGEDGELEYRSHIHLCIDNCANSGINEDGMFVRLAYPDPDRKPYPSPAPAFIVVGGSTLSRGLTIEGLVSTYFLRSSCQADSLMQMGRWFGYRQGYELLPRIWMTEDTENKFKFLSLLEYELREDLARFTLLKADPSVYGPRVKNTPNASWLRITARNRMQSAIETEFDFMGTSSQTIFFDNNEELLRKNIEITERFLEGLGNGEKSDITSAYVWRNVRYEQILNNFLDSFHFNNRTRLFNEIKGAFSEWVIKNTEEGNITNWNVIAAGGKTNNKEDKTWKLHCGSVGKVNRSRKKTNDPNLINIGVLRAPIDLLADVPRASAPVNIDDIESRAVSNIEIENIRNKAGLGKTPQLIIYRIDKNSKARSNSKERVDLNASEDLIGLHITIPGMGIGGKGNRSKALTIKINQDEIETNDNWGEEE